MELNIFFWFLLLTTPLFLIGSFLVLKKLHFTFPGKQLPPGPPALPLIGNILDLGSDINQSLYKLRLKYGNLLWLRLGWTNTLVVQTAKAAEELFKHRDSSFCNRRVNESMTALDFHKGVIALCPYGSNWRVLRRLVTLGLMTSKKIQDSVLVRRRCVDDMIRFIQVDSDAVRNRGESGEIELAKYVFVMAFNLMGNLVLSRDLVDPQSEDGNEFFHAMGKLMELVGTMNLADFFPFLKRFDPQRVKKNTEIHLRRIMRIVEKFVMERMEDWKLKKERDTRDFLDSVLEYNEAAGDGGIEGEEKFSTHSIIITIVEIFFGGTETTSATIEWVMTELFRSPESMTKVKEELNRVVGSKRKVEESDIDRAGY